MVVWLVYQKQQHRKMFVSDHRPQGDLTAHMQLYRASLKSLANGREAGPFHTTPGNSIVPAYAGSLKDNGTWGRNSLFNNAGFAHDMCESGGFDAGPVQSIAQRNEGFDMARGMEKERAHLKDKYGDVPCSEMQLREAQSLYQNGDYIKVPVFVPP
jgi:hypothetical protein